MNQIEISPVVSYLRRARRHYKKLKLRHDQDYFEYLGVSPSLRNNWYNTGIKPIYFKVLDLLEKIEALERDRS